VGVVVTVGEIGITSRTMVVTVEGWFITVVGAWWSGSAEQGGQIQPPTSPRENMDLRVGPGSPEQVLVTWHPSPTQYFKAALCLDFDSLYFVPTAHVTSWMALW